MKDRNEKNSNEYKEIIEEHQTDRNLHIQEAVGQPNVRYTIPRVIKNILNEGWPYVTSRFLSVGGYFISAVIISKYDVNILPSTPLINSYEILTLGTAVGSLYSTAITVGKRIGAKRPHKMGKIFQGHMILSALYSAPVITLMLFSKPILQLFGQNEQLSTYVLRYFQGFAGGIPAALAFNVAQQMLIGFGKPKTVLALTALRISLTGGLGYWFTFGGGIPALGIMGMGFANTAANWVSLAVTVGYFKFSSRFKQYKIFKRANLRRLKNIIIESIKLGLPIGVQVMAELVTLLGVTIFAGNISTLALSEMQVADQYLSMFVVAAFGFSQTAGAMVSRELGKKNFFNGRRIGNIALGIGGVFSALAALLLIFGYEPLTDVFDSRLLNVASQKETIRYLFLINGVTEIFDFARNISPGALRGYYKTKLPVVINILTMWGIALGIGYLVGIYFDKGLIGIYLARSLGIALGAIGNVGLWLYSSNKKMSEDKSLTYQEIKDEPENRNRFFFNMLSDISRESGISKEDKENEESTAIGSNSKKKSWSFSSLCTIS